MRGIQRCSSRPATPLATVHQLSPQSQPVIDPDGSRKPLCISTSSRKRLPPQTCSASQPAALPARQRLAIRIARRRRP